MNQLHVLVQFFTPGFNLGFVGKKTEGESADSRCVDEKVKG